MTYRLKKSWLSGIAFLFLMACPVMAQEPAREGFQLITEQSIQKPIAIGNAAVPASTAASAGRSTPLSYVPLSGGEKWRYYFRSTYGPLAWGRTLAWAGIDQWRDANPEWGQGMEGFGKRFGSKYGQLVIKRSIGHGLGSLLHEDPRYFRSEESGVWPRTFHAVEWTFLTHTDDGRTKFADARIVGTFGAALISRAWHPEPERNLRNGFESGGISLAIDVGWNVFKEFWPDIRQRLHH